MMNIDEAKEIARKYDEYDTKFRAAKKQGRYGEDPRPWKAKRDALAEKLTEALKVIREETK